MQPTSYNLLQLWHSGHFSPSPDKTPTAPKSLLGQQVCNNRSSMVGPQSTENRPHLGIWTYSIGLQTSVALLTAPAASIVPLCFSQGTHNRPRSLERRQTANASMSIWSTWGPRVCYQSQADEDVTGACSPLQRPLENILLSESAHRVSQPTAEAGLTMHQN